MFSLASKMFFPIVLPQRQPKSTTFYIYCKLFYFLFGNKRTTLYISNIKRGAIGLIYNID